jgi:hypothetical protein
MTIRARWRLNTLWTWRTNRRSCRQTTSAGPSAGEPQFRDSDKLISWFFPQDYRQTRCRFISGPQRLSKPSEHRPVPTLAVRITRERHMQRRIRACRGHVNCVVRIIPPEANLFPQIPHRFVGAIIRRLGIFTLSDCSAGVAQLSQRERSRGRFAPATCCRHAAAWGLRTSDMPTRCSISARTRSITPNVTSAPSCDGSM